MNEAPPLSSIPAQPRNCGLATWSLVLGILAMLVVVLCLANAAHTLFLAILLAIPAVICGHLSYSQVKRSAGALSGEELALGGLVAGYLAICLTVPLTVADFGQARSSSQTNVCIHNLWEIYGAKQNWAIENKKSGTDTPTAQELEAFLHKSFSSLKCPAGGVYTIHAVDDKPTCSIPSHTYQSSRDFP
jgi:hypothetical protein